VKFPDDEFTDPKLVTKDKRFMLPIGATAKQALEMVYRGEIVLSPQQMRAAIECLQFEVPKVSAVAIGHMNGQDFASALERAIERSKGPPLLNGPVEQLPASTLKRPMQRFRRY
jgi:hypothetical protein